MAAVTSVRNDLASTQSAFMANANPIVVAITPIAIFATSFLFIRPFSLV